MPEPLGAGGQLDFRGRGGRSRHTPRLRLPDDQRLRTAAAFQELLTPEQQKAYVDALSPIDAAHYVGHAAPAKLLFQFAKTDEFISPWDAEVYVQAASRPKEVKWYDTDHFFNEEARREREKWLESACSR